MRVQIDTARSNDVLNNANHLSHDLCDDDGDEMINTLSSHI